MKPLRLAAPLFALAFSLWAPRLMAAPGMNLMFDDCTLGAPFSYHNDPCTSDAGPPKRIIFSMDPQGTIPDVIGAQGYIHVGFPSSTPDFWRLDAGGCRAGQLTLISDFTANGSVSCPEPWSGAGTIAHSLTIQPETPCPGRLQIVWTIMGTQPVEISTNIAPDWYMARLDLARTGTTSCPGCSIQACLVAIDLKLFRPAGHPEGTIYTAAPAVSTHLAWQSGSNCPPTGAGVHPIGCPVHNENSTWGQIKSMYR